jgi:hypothetical protein
MDSYQDFVLPRYRLLDFLELKLIRRPIAGV